MDYGKIDPALAAALDDVDTGREATSDAAPAQFSVFVHLDPDASAKDRAALTGFGLPKNALKRSIATATLSSRDIAELSEHPCVRSLKLSQPLRLLGEE